MYKARRGRDLDEPGILEPLPRTMYSVLRKHALDSRMGRETEFWRNCAAGFRRVVGSGFVPEAMEGAYRGADRKGQAPLLKHGRCFDILLLLGVQKEEQVRLLPITDAQRGRTDDDLCDMPRV